MRLTTKGRFAVTAMIDLAALRGGEGPVTLAGISERQKISLSYLEQLFGKLRRHQLVDSVRGRAVDIVWHGHRSDHRRRYHPRRRRAARCNTMRWQGKLPRRASLHDAHLWATLNFTRCTNTCPRFRWRSRRRGTRHKVVDVRRSRINVSGPRHGQR